ncbi:YchJ family protein [Eionea flava]
MSTDLCVCCSGKVFSHCCMPFLTGKKYPPTPEKLMRSRFSAYALGGYGEYLLLSWLPALTVSLHAIDLSRRDTEWQSLRVVQAQQAGEQATVIFDADFVDAQGVLQTYHEQSQFVRVNKRWLYAGIAVE